MASAYIVVLEYAKRHVCSSLYEYKIFFKKYLLGETSVNKGENATFVRYLTHV